MSERRRFFTFPSQKISGRMLLPELANADTAPSTPRRTLNGWKEIAAYLGKSVRSVQRWEVVIGLPVHRIQTPDGQIVYAKADEIDLWRMLSISRRLTNVSLQPNLTCALWGGVNPASRRKPQNRHPQLHGVAMLDGRRRHNHSSGRRRVGTTAGESAADADGFPDRRGCARSAWPERDGPLDVSIQSHRQRNHRTTAPPRRPVPRRRPGWFG